MIDDDILPTDLDEIRGGQHGEPERLIMDALEKAISAKADRRHSFAEAYGKLVVELLRDEGYLAP